MYRLVELDKTTKKEIKSPIQTGELETLDFLVKNMLSKEGIFIDKIEVGMIFEYLHKLYTIDKKKNK
jgi:hypothetical protein